MCVCVSPSRLRSASALFFFCCRCSCTTHLAPPSHLTAHAHSLCCHTSPPQISASTRPSACKQAVKAAKSTNATTPSQAPHLPSPHKPRPVVRG
ncbi:hypothetical protein B0J12DRAFT_338563 [Macrophomina phaseolina]|uniref:Secreted protein n=1 Tax=Macrophomina phaseolina TaxID=35725 RepID=A0ABQ8GLQ3_9PEZI|nr:hypothetical protein B0J12DRAFT_338563 [Macrophomina phaseolina]